MRRERKGAVLLLVCLAAGLGVLFFVSGDPFRQNLMERLAGPSAAHFLGTDHLGRDFGARVARGAFNSMILSSLCVGCSVAAGIFLALASLCGGGRTEALLLLVTDMVMAFPGIVLAIVLGSVTGGGPGAVAFALVFTGWPRYFRMALSLLKRVWNAPFAEAARIAGFPSPVLCWKYLVPELVPTLGVMASLGWGKTILEISSLGFLGIGVSPPEPELGAMISEGLSYMRSSPRVVAVPGVLISLFVLAFLLFGSKEEEIKGGMRS